MPHFIFATRVLIGHSAQVSESAIWHWPSKSRGKSSTKPRYDTLIPFNLAHNFPCNTLSHYSTLRGIISNVYFHAIQSNLLNSFNRFEYTKFRAFIKLLCMQICGFVICLRQSAPGWYSEGDDTSSYPCHTLFYVDSIHVYVIKVT
jgi:hypothetical protein